MPLHLSQYLRKFFYYDRCSVCNEILSSSEIYICKKCQEIFKNNNQLKNFKNIYYIFKYDSDFKNLIKNYKFYNRKYLGFFISHLIERNLKKVIEEKDIDIIIPVPLNKKRFFSRGFNQVSYILDILDIDYQKIIRTKDTKHMSLLLDKNMRKFNIRNAFSIPFEVNGKNILIIDDIITTGSTIREIIKEINHIGKSRSITIFVFSMAKTFEKSNLGRKNENISR